MFYLFFFILGTAIGSFLNVLVDRLPAEESILGRSHCDKCKKELKWKDLVPVLSFIWLRAKCRYCSSNLSFFYPLVELITGGLFVFVAWFASRASVSIFSPDILESLLRIHVGTLTLVALLGVVSCVIVIFFADLKYQIIPDSIQIALFGFSFLLLVTRGITPYIFLKQVLAAFAVMSPILLLFLITKGRGMGFGDVKLAFTMGFLLGILEGSLALYIGFIAGAVVGVILIFAKKKGLKSKIAFGPFLVLGFLIMLFYGSHVVQIIHSFYTF